MPITDTFILPGDILLLPVAELPENVREKLSHKEGDFAITRPHVRTPSKIVDAHAAELLKEFQTPKTIVEAILNYSDNKQADPHQALEEALPLLKNFIDARLLVSPDSPEAESITPTLSAGDIFDEFEIVEVVQTLEDTELYRAKAVEGDQPVALKIVRNTGRSDLQESFQREATVLNHLDGKVNQRLIKTGSHDGRPYLAIEWFAGVPLTFYADEILQLASGVSEVEDVSDARKRLQSLVVSLLDSYAHLHEQGIIHSDVHPNNLLVNDANEIKILDFGLARFIDKGHPLNVANRGGVGFYFEPECVQAMIVGREVPPSSPAGEQYAVAAIAYQLLTGTNHINFSFNNEEMLRQIVEEETLPFTTHGLMAWPEMEGHLVQALSKDAQRRFASMRDFADAVRNVQISTNGTEAIVPEPASVTSVWSRKEPARAQLKQPHEDFIQKVLRRLQPEGKLFQSEIGEGHPLPTCSADYGTAGIAYGLLRLACNREDPQLLALADLWITKTLEYADQESAFYNEKLELTKENLTEVSLHHMVNGVYFVRSLISGALGDTLTQHSAIEAFIGSSQAEADKLDITLGSYSVLHGCSLLVEDARSSPFLDMTPLLDLGDQVMHGTWDKISKLAPVKECAEPSLLGMAHGWAGLLYAPLRWCKTKAETSNVEASELLPEGFAGRLKELSECGIPGNRGLLWPFQNELAGDFASGNNGFMPGWCNGNAGLVFLWTLAHEVCGDPHYLELARRAGWGAWEQQVQFNNLCCGAGGCAYALLNLYRHTGDKDWLTRTRQLAHRVVTTEEPPSEHESDVNSLYKGEIGLMVLLDDLASPETARMPLFE